MKKNIPRAQDDASQAHEILVGLTFSEHFFGDVILPKSNFNIDFIHVAISSFQSG